MRAFETVRRIYLVLYGAIWAVALLVIVGSIIAVFSGNIGNQPLNSVILIVAGVVLLAMVLSWLILITICAIDSRNFLADMRQFQIDRLEQSMQTERQQGDRYDRNI